jgi:hypothetical protein
MKKYYYILGCILAFTALGAIPAGLIYLVDTSGVKMGQTTALLADSPFTSFLVPGLFLLFVNGLGSAVAAALCFLRNHNAAITGMAIGFILCLWIIIQVYMIGFNSWLQPVFLLVGMTETLMGWAIWRGKSN